MIPNPREPQPASAPPGSALLDPPRPATKAGVACATCRSLCGHEQLAMVAGRPTCATCRARLRRRTMPKWVAVGACVLVALLGVGVLRGGHWLVTGSALLRAHRLADASRWPEATSDLDTVLRDAPGCTDAKLLRIQAALFGDDQETAQRLIEEVGLSEQTGVRAEAVRALVGRHRDAMAAFDQASVLLQRNRVAQALPLLDRAREAFPESHRIQVQLLTCHAAVRFERGDWDGYLEFAQRAAEAAPDDPLQQAMVASALAAKFVATPKAELRERCEAQLRRAESLCRTGSQIRDLTEYREQVLRQLDPVRVRGGRR